MRLLRLCPAVNALCWRPLAQISSAANRPAWARPCRCCRAGLGLPSSTVRCAFPAGEAELSRFGGLTQEAFPSRWCCCRPRRWSPSRGCRSCARGRFGRTHGASVGAGARWFRPRQPCCRTSYRRGRSWLQGRGDLQIARDLAAALGAELACSRPLAEGTAWLSKDRYVGVSACTLLSDLYLAAGISGQVQHTSGMSDSKSLLAVNSDANARSLRLLTTESWATSMMSCLRSPQHFPEEEYV